jgi:hypothetical protein
MFNHLALREQEVRQLVLSQHTRVGFTIERCDAERDQFIGEHWTVVLKKQNGTKTLFVYDVVVNFPNNRLKCFQDVYKPTEGNISFTLNEKEMSSKVTPRTPIGYTGEIVQLICTDCQKSFSVTKQYYESHDNILYCHECSFLMDIDETIAKSEELLRQLREQEEKDAAFAALVTRFKMLMDRHCSHEEAEPQPAVQPEKKLPVTCSRCGKYLGSTARKQPVKVLCAECDPPDTNGE